MTEHDRIWLEPAGAPDRCWCQDNVWGDEAVEYVRVDLITPAPAPHLRGAADAYVAEQGIEHSGGIVERAFEAGAQWAVDKSAEIVDHYIGGGRSFVMRRIAALTTEGQP